MKVILNKDIKELGKAGSLVNVNEGYARNFLFPRKLAILADEGAMKNIEKKKKTQELKKANLLAEAKEIAQKLESIKITIYSKAGTEGRLFGSVTNSEIAEALSKQHKINVDKRKITLSDPIKNVGSFHANVKLHTNVSTDINVEVLAKTE